jgi:hypothetical protein
MMNKLTAIKIKNYSSEQTGIVTVHRPDSLKLILSLAICPLARVVWMAVLGGEIYAQDKALIISVPMTLTELLWRAHWDEDDVSQAAGIAWFPDIDEQRDNVARERAYLLGLRNGE